MKDQLTYIKYYYINSAYRLFYNKLTRKKLILNKYAAKEIFESSVGNDIIRIRIQDDKPFMAARFGSGELRAFVQALGVKLKIRDVISKSTISALCSNAGFFPPEQEAVIKFAELMKYSCNYADMIGVWMNHMEDYVIKLYSPRAVISGLRAIEPYYHNEPWTKALEGKRVLIIHPFEKTIQSQYEKRKTLFKDRDILPDFELRTLKAVQTIAGQQCEFNTWFDALDYMVNRALKIDFDVAIVGCGAYGFPLAAKLKKAGKQAIHMGGATQILFGIKGNRWDNHEIISRYYNENWVRPLKEETPSNAAVVEGGCYW